MIGKGMFAISLKVVFIIVLLFIPSHILFSEDNNNQPDECLEKALVKRMKEIIDLPESKYLHTLDGQNVLLNEFHDKCLHLWPQCSLFKKFYYWQSEIRNEVSNTKNGVIRHKIRCYHDCMSAFRPKSFDLKKTHGDVAEFYDGNGDFMGLAAYMGDGNYCTLPYDSYKK